MSLNQEQFGQFMTGVGTIAGAPKVRKAIDHWVEEAKADLNQMMVDQVSPNGVPYQDLAPLTVAKKGHSIALFETGNLNASLIGTGGSGHIENVTDTSATLGTEHKKNGKPVAEHMQYGLKRGGKGDIPARPFVGVTDDMAQKAAEFVGDELMAQIAAVV